MIRFPVLNRLRVKGYELYPGPPPDHAGLEADFTPGLTLVVGANGLGKSTLVLMLFRLLSGPADLRGQSRDGLGSGQLEVRSLRRDELRTFSERVNDGAAQAFATLDFSLGDTQISISRDLATLSAVALMVDGEEFGMDEDVYRSVIADRAGVAGFVDWLLILRYLVFYFDDRRSLVWDPTAQRRMLPLLFLPGGTLEPNPELTRSILQEDSAVRNLSAALTRQEAELRKQEFALAKQPAMEHELRGLAQLRDALEAQLAELEERLPVLEADRAAARLQALQSAERRSSVAGELDELRYAQLEQAFPSKDETAKYLLLSIVDDDHCLACGNHVPDYAAELRTRLESYTCVLCGSDNHEKVTARADLVGSEEVIAARVRLQEATDAYDSAQKARAETESIYVDSLAKVARLNREVTELNANIDRLERALPDANRTLSKRRQGINELRAQNMIARERVLEMKAELGRVADEQNRQLSAYKDAVKDHFDAHATDFLLEDCHLVWGNHLEQIGQLGKPISFSVFQVDMTGGGLSGATRRERAEQVSESQREFIDLAFRMALVSIAGEGGSGTLIMDAPESSLDAIFAPRAARVLTGFGKANLGSRVIITSNLVEGLLIPTIAEELGIVDADDPHVVNLFDIAAPTGALRQHEDEYREALGRAFGAAT